MTSEETKAELSSQVIGNIDKGSFPGSRIIQGDALLILPTLPSASVDAVITDPPYCSGGRSSAERTSRTAVEKYQQSDVKKSRPNFEGDSRDQLGYIAWCALWMAECLRIAREGSPICVFTDWRQLPATTDALQAGGWIWRGIAVWDKTGGARKYLGRFTNQCEYIVWGSKGAMSTDRGVDSSGIDRVGTLPGVFTHPVRQADKFHLTGKPTPLMRDVVKITRPGGHILDPFFGSGTTGVAAEEGNYGFTGIELGAENCDIARCRTQRSIDSETQLAPDRE